MQLALKLLASILLLNLDLDMDQLCQLLLMAKQFNLNLVTLLWGSRSTPLALHLELEEMLA